MSVTPNIFRNSAAGGAMALALALCVWPASWEKASAQQPGESEKDLLFKEARTALRTARERNKALEVRLAEAEKNNRVLAESLAAANGEAEEFRKLHEEIRLQLEAFGFEAVKGGEAVVKSRLIQAASGLQAANERAGALSDQLFSLSSAIILHLESPKEASDKSRLALEKALRATDSVLGIGAKKEERKARSLDEGRVVSISDFNLIVLDVGEDSGVVLGMPFTIVRKDRPIGTVRVVDARKSIAGATVLTLEDKNEFFKAGDTIQVLTQN